MVADFDGSLRNPAILIGVVTWALMLSVLAVIAVAAFQSRPRIALLLGALAVAGGTVTEQAQRFLAQLVIRSSNPGLVVGFFGGPPAWLAPTAAAVVAILVAIALYVRRGSRTPSAVTAPPESGSQVP